MQHILSSRPSDCAQSENDPDLAWARLTCTHLATGTEKIMMLVKSLATAAVLALLATGPALADCSYSKQDTVAAAEAAKAAEVAAAAAVADAAKAATASTEVASITPATPEVVKPN